MTAKKSIPYQINITAMTCEHCVAKVKDVALSLNQVEHIDINLKKGQAQVYGGVPAEVVQAISDAGYPSKQIQEPASYCASTSHTSSAEQKNTLGTVKNTDSYMIAIKDMTCSSCVSNVEKAILSVDGVIEASVNLLEKSALVVGGVSREVIKAIIDQGYNASLLEQQRLGNTYLINITGAGEDQVSEVLSSHLNIKKFQFISIDSNNTVRVSLTTSLHPGYILAGLKKAQIQSSIDEQFDDPYAEQAIQIKTEVRLSWLRVLVAGTVGVGLMLGNMTGIFPELDKNSSVYGISSQFFWFIIALLCLLAMWFSGRQYYMTAIKQAKHGSANMDTLVALGTSAAWLSSMIIIINPQFIPGGGHLYLDAAVIILAFLQIGHVLEIQAKRTTSESIASIIELAPKTARLVVENIAVDIPVSLLQIGDVIQIKPGERLPIDGVIVNGASSIDESMLTGEPLPVKKGAGDMVTGGSINKMGNFSFTVSRLGGDTTLAHIIKMVKQAQMTKPAIGRLVDKIAAVFVPIVIVIAILTFFIWLFVGPQPQLAYALTAGIAVLVIACPCALGLATPIAIMMGTAKAAQLNILIKNSDALQSASQLTHIVVDKTGTLTQGNPSITDVIMNPDLSLKLNMSEQRVIQLAASLEVNSEHPLADAVLNTAKEKDIALLKIEKFLAVESRGVQGFLSDGQSILLGNAFFMQENNIAIPSGMQQHSEQLSQSAATPVWIAGGGQLLGLMGIKDPLRDDTFKSIQSLQEQNIVVVMCSGDTRQTALSVASELGITEIHSEVKPQDKLIVIKELQQKGYKVGMVGDGVNDAPALAQSDTGFAIGSGTDVAIENADITLLGNSLMDVSTAIAISTATIKNIKQNLLGAFIYNILGIPLAAGLFYPLTGWLLAPAFASAAMAMSSVTVVVNANRLRFFKP